MLDSIVEVVQVRKTRKRSTLRRETAVKRKSGGLTKLKKKLDAVFSKYIRAKYPKVCFTCDKAGVLQNGHFIVRKYLATRWEEDNCRPQCIGCNIYGKGMFVDFEERLLKEIGAERMSEMKESRKELWRLDENWYLSKIRETEEKLNEIQTL